MSSEDTGNKLFPTKTTFIIFITYISLFVSQGLLVTAVHRFNVHGFNATIVVLLTEVTKLVICIVIHVARSEWQVERLFSDVKKNLRLLLLYLVPSFLYCLYNNLTFINLELFDLTTYYCLMQFRIVLTAIIYQILFQRKLNYIQWLSLAILTLGCLIKEYGVYQNIPTPNINKLLPTTNTIINNSTITPILDATFRQANQTTVNQGIETHYHGKMFEFLYLTSLLILQMFCSCFAGVYNEYLLKDSSTANNADVILQNIFMYLDSIICNICVYVFVPNQSKHAKSEPIDLTFMLGNLITNPIVLTLILNNAISGLVASFFLKSLNSILKTFASALELFAVAFLAWILFGNSIDIHTVVALILVSSALTVYSKSPVSVAPPEKSVTTRKDGFMLLPTSDD